MQREPYFQAPPRAADVYAQATDGWTLAAVEQKLGYQTYGAGDMESQWLEAVRVKPLRELADDDLARLLSRGMHLPLTLPVALSRLRSAADSKVLPDAELVRACGQAAAMARRSGSDLPEKTTTVLQVLLQTPWSGDRTEVLEAVFAAIEASRLPPPAPA